MRRSIRLGPASLALALGASLATADDGTTDHLLFRETHLGGGLSIAFVGDGFDLEGLPTYGTAVNSLIQGLLRRDVFDTHRSRFNFYRIDVVDDTGETEDLCAAQTLEKLTGLALRGDSDPPVDGTKPMDLAVQRCWGGGNSLVLYTSKEFEAIELAAAVPDLKAVVVVANARLTSGAAQLLVTPQQTTVVVVGAHASPTDETKSEWEIDDLAITTLTHELGHALGLLDEYDHLNTPQAPDFQECRNVWKPDAAPQWPATPTWPASEKPVPWQQILTRCCSPETMVRCQAHDPDGSCVLQDLTPAQAYCSYVPRSGNPHGSCDPPPECNAFPGAWEGAFYSETGYYRATATCRMSSMGVRQRFCPACRQYLDLYLEHFGGTASTAPWPEERCQSPVCPPAAPPETPAEAQRSDVH